MLEWLLNIDKELFVLINSWYHPLLDPVFRIISSTSAWIPLHGFLLFVIFKKYRWQGLWFLLGVGLVVLFADRFTSGFMKPFFGRLRPCHDPQLEGLIHLAKGCGGQFGFASSHAANSFGVATFIWLYFGKDFKWMKWMFLWALLVSYSRIYLGVHYPGDVIVGALVGSMGAVLIFLSFKTWLFPRINHLRT